MAHYSCNEATPELIVRLANSRKQQVDLLKLASELGCHNNLKLRKCLQQDQSLLLSLLRKAVQRHDAKEVIFALPEEAAFAFLNLIDSLIADENLQATNTTALDDFCRVLYRISVRLCEKLHRLPESFHVTGVKISNRDNIASASGASADIYKGSLGGQLVAVKVLCMFYIDDDQPKKVEAFYREIALLHHLKHININSMLGVDRQLFPEKICLISPWMHYGNIREYVRTNGFNEREVHRLLADVASGLAYLHNQNIAHGDLRGPNILIDEERRVKLTDFGLSNFADTSQSSAITGAVRWMAPEVLDPDEFGLPHACYTTASDVYSFAHVFWELYNDQDPFPQFKRPVQVIMPVLKGQRPERTSSSRKFPGRIWRIMEQCWQHNPKDRPSATTIKHKLLDYSRSEPKPHYQLMHTIVPLPNDSFAAVGSFTISHHEVHWAGPFPPQAQQMEAAQLQCMNFWVSHERYLSAHAEQLLTRHDQRQVSEPPISCQG